MNPDEIEREEQKARDDAAAGNEQQAEYHREKVRALENRFTGQTCTECGDFCKAVEETFDYSGTHCTNGVSGTHHTGHLVSACCLAEISEARDLT